MIKTDVIDEQVEKVLATTPVNKAQELMKSRSGFWLIMVISFIESSLPLPILTDPFMVAALVMNRVNSFKIICATILSSILGGIVAYFSALLFLEKLLDWMTPGMVSQFQSLVSSSESSTFVLTIVGAVTPVPYTLVAWAVAVLEGSLLIFIIGSIIGRTFRYGVIGYCVYKFGPAAVSYAKKYLGLTSILIFILAGIFLWLKL